MLPCLHANLSPTQVGQRAEVLTKASRLADDVSRFPYGAALQGDVLWRVTCHNVTRPSKMSIEDRMAATRIRKEWGNELFFQNRTSAALEKYEIAYNVIRPQILTGNSQQQVCVCVFVRVGVRTVCMHVRTRARTHTCTCAAPITFNRRSYPNSRSPVYTRSRKRTSTHTLRHCIAHTAALYQPRPRTGNQTEQHRGDAAQDRPLSQQGRMLQAPRTPRRRSARHYHRVL